MLLEIDRKESPALVAEMRFAAVFPPQHYPGNGTLDERIKSACAEVLGSHVAAAAFEFRDCELDSGASLEATLEQRIPKSWEHSQKLPPADS